MTIPVSAGKAIQRHPAYDLLCRYRAILGAAWTRRAELAGPKRLADEAAFLPAALSLQDTPVHPAPRRFAFGIIALFTSVQEQLNASQSEVVRTAALLQRLTPSGQAIAQPIAQFTAQSTANVTILLNKELLKHSGQGLQTELTPKNGKIGLASHSSELSGPNRLNRSARWALIIQPFRRNSNPS